MLSKIADELERISASIDFIDEVHAVTAIEAAMGAARHLLKAMTVEVFRLTTAVVDPFASPVPEKIFKRYAKELDLDVPVARAKLSSTYDIYRLTVIDGPWTWACDEKTDVWIEDNGGGSIPQELDNKASLEKPKMPRRHFRFYENTRAVIAIPLYHTVGDSDQVIGLISFEFESRKPHNKELCGALKKIANLVADVIWKGNTWDDSKSGTRYVVEKFTELCNALRTDSLPNKTCLFSPDTLQFAEIRAKCQESSRNDKIEMDTYDCEADSTVLSRRESGQDMISFIQNEHFGIFDITSNNPSVFFVLGIMFAEGKPCMILADDIMSKLPPIIARLATAVGQNTGQLLHLYKYHKENGLTFLDSNNEAIEWQTIWKDFLRKVETISLTFLTASDGRSEILGN
jgi:hypothetical protein